MSLQVHDNNPYEVFNSVRNSSIQWIPSEIGVEPDPEPEPFLPSPEPDTRKYNVIDDTISRTPVPDECPYPHPYSSRNEETKQVSIFVGREAPATPPSVFIGRRTSSYKELDQHSKDPDTVDANSSPPDRSIGYENRKELIQDLNSVRDSEFDISDTTTSSDSEHEDPVDPETIASRTILYVGEEKREDPHNNIHQQINDTPPPYQQINNTPLPFQPFNETPLSVPIPNLPIDCESTKAYPGRRPFCLENLLPPAEFVCRPQEIEGQETQTYFEEFEEEDTQSTLTATSSASHIFRGLHRLKESYPLSNTRQVNCLLLGRMGNGKSSLINTIYQSLTDTMDTLCVESSGHQSTTIRYACCAELYEKKHLPILLYDTKGLPDSNDNDINRLIKLLLIGKFKPQHSMNNPKWHDCYLFPDKTLKIDVIIFVHSIGAIFPLRLAQAVMSEASERHVSVIPVLTYYDLVSNDKDMADDVDICSRTFNTKPFYLTNLNALRAKAQTLSEIKFKAQMNFTKKTAVDIVSQAMVYGQQHQRKKRYPLNQPIDNRSPECSVM